MSDKPQHYKDLRDEFAMAALTGLLSDSRTIVAASPSSCKTIAGSAYEYADYMLAERVKNANR